MRKNKIHLSIFFAAFILIASCVEPFNMVIKTDATVLIIDGSIDDSDRDQYINVKKYVPSSEGYIQYIAETGAQLSVIEDSKKAYICLEKPNGLYYLPIGFKTKVGSSYQLKIMLKDGKSYESGVEKMRQTPDIENSEVKFEPQGINSGENKTPAHFVYISTKDSKESGDNYLWRWKLYEKQRHCITCYGGLYLTSPAPLGKCQTVAALVNQNVFYDYYCNGNCYEMKFSEEINVMSDVYSNGKEISNRLVAKVPFYERNGCLIQIIQQNVSPSAFRYLKILGSQSQNNGTLVDSPPAPLIGNIYNINDKKESVSGYFMVGSSKIKNIWIPRNDTGDSSPIYLLGRKENIEPSSPDGSRPPYAPCIKSNTRTPLTPEGWPL